MRRHMGQMRITRVVLALSVAAPMQGLAQRACTQADSAVENAVWRAALRHWGGMSTALAISTTTLPGDATRDLLGSGLLSSDDTSLGGRLALDVGCGPRNVPTSVQRSAPWLTWRADSALPPRGRRLGRLPDPGPRDHADSVMVAAWASFHAAHFTGVIRLSRVAVRVDGNAALVYSESRESPAGGPVIRVLRLERQPAGWRVAEDSVIRE